MLGARAGAYRHDDERHDDTRHDYALNGVVGNEHEDDKPH